MSVKQRLRDSCRKAQDPATGKLTCGCATEVSDDEWQAAGDDDAKRHDNLCSIAMDVSMSRCSCQGSPSIDMSGGKRILSVRCASSPTTKLP